MHFNSQRWAITAPTPGGIILQDIHSKSHRKLRHWLRSEKAGQQPAAQPADLLTCINLFTGFYEDKVYKNLNAVELRYN